MAKDDEINNLLAKVDVVEARKFEIEKMMENQAILSNSRKLAEISREHKHISDIMQVAIPFRESLQSLKSDKEILHESDDEELKEMASEEIAETEAKLGKFEADLKALLIPRDPQDDKNAMMEIRAGTGGDEAALFAGDLYRMYVRYIEKMGWKIEVMSSNPTGLGGFKEIIFSVLGTGSYGMLKYESGVHRVQRVPATETSGRLHTSAASVVVLPEAEEVDVEIKTNELRIDVYRSSGPGGQSVNTTDSAVRITHVPTGLVVTCQDEKSQHKNKAKALKVLRSRLYEIKMKEEEAKQAASRRSMIRSGDRSMKIRTFNFPQGRVTDHRINLTLYRLDEILSGDLDEVIEKLQLAEREEKLKE